MDKSWQRGWKRIADDGRKTLTQNQVSHFLASMKDITENLVKTGSSKGMNAFGQAQTSLCLRWLLCFALIFALFACQAETPKKVDEPVLKDNVDEPGLKGKVVKISDGDTITILVDNEQHRIRLDGIDCPEKKQAYGQKAKEFVSDLVFGDTVRIVWEEKDFFGRILGVVYNSDGVNVNEELLKAGLAWHYKQYNKDARLAELENAARKAKLGLWQDKNPTPPWEFRKAKKK